jgi:neurofibromin 1
MRAVKPGQVEKGTLHSQICTVRYGSHCSLFFSLLRRASRIQATFLRELKSALARRQIAKVAAICYVDICKAATYVSRSENSALGQLVPEIEEDLKTCLFDPNRPFQTDAQVDQRLMTDCLTALFRLNPSKTLNELVPVCLAPNAHSAFRLVLVKSCNAIASEVTYENQ